jgi:hypothetical protein
LGEGNDYVTNVKHGSHLQRVCMSAAPLLIPQQINLIKQQHSIARGSGINIPFLRRNFDNAANYNITRHISRAAIARVERAHKQQLVDALHHTGNARDEVAIPDVRAVAMQELADVICDGVAGNDHLIFESGHLVWRKQR